MIVQIVACFVVILVAVSLMPMIADQVNIAAETANVTGANLQILNLMPAFFGLAVLLLGFFMIMSALRSGGLIGGGDYDLETISRSEEYDSSSADLHNLVKERAIELAKKDSYYKTSQLRPRDKEYKPVYTDGGSKFD